MAKRIRKADDLEMITVISPKSRGGFIETPIVKELTDRSLRYINVGYPVHLCGPTGCGKTTLAMHIATKLERPVILINGDEEFSTSSLIGGEVGFNKKKVVDRYVSRVTKVEESYRKNWVDERLTAACKYGFTLVYNEFTRSRPEANNVLLSVIEERILPLPSSASRNTNESYIKVHPSFSAIFTSNPEEYAGVYQSQDALSDRMITINMNYFDEKTETEIVQAKSTLSPEDAGTVVRLVRGLRDSGLCEFTPTLRSSIVIASAIDNVDDPSYRQTCIDVLGSKISSNNGHDATDVETILDEFIEKEKIQCNRSPAHTAMVKE